VSRGWLDEAYTLLYGELERIGAPTEDSDSYIVLGAVGCVPRHMQLIGTEKVEIQGESRVVTRTMSPDAPLLDISMPPGQFAVRFTESDRSLGFWRLYLVSKRIRSHVSFHCGTGIPMIYLYAGPNLLFPTKLFGDLDRFMAYRGPAEPADIEAWRSEVVKRYDLARQTLATLTPDSDLDRAICLFGEGLVQEDIEESYSCFWRAVERIAKMDLRRARTAVQSGDKEAAVPYALELLPGLVNSQPTTLDTEDAVVVTVRKRVPDYSGPAVKELYSLRTAIVHENPTPEEMMRIARLRTDLVALSSAVVRSALSESTEKNPDLRPDTESRPDLLHETPDSGSN